MFYNLTQYGCDTDLKSTCLNLSSRIVLDADALHGTCTNELGMVRLISISDI